jgi:hypothetical protein
MNEYMKTAMPPSNKNSDVREEKGARGWSQTKLTASTRRPEIKTIPATRMCLGLSGSLVLIGPPYTDQLRRMYRIYRYPRVGLSQQRVRQPRDVARSFLTALVPSFFDTPPAWRS